MSSATLQKDIQSLLEKTIESAEQAQDLAQLSTIESLALSKKGALSEILKRLGSLPAADRPLIGALANSAKTRILEVIEEKKTLFEKAALAQKLEQERLDISLPSLKTPRGSLHPITTIIEEIIGIFERLGFELATGPEVENEFHNFDALNISKDHPARDMQDTFYLKDSPLLLRTQTSPVQIRTMLEKKPPLRILCPGAVFRSDYDVTHSPMFHQIEGLYVDRKASFAELKGCLSFFAQEMFGTETQIRFRPSYFPFVEPGTEVDVSCVICKGQGKTQNEPCRVCKETGWLEILGAGMVHPEVFKAVGYKDGEYQGFAFGLGIERIAMLKYGIPDLRLLFENDIRFLKQLNI